MSEEKKEDLKVNGYSDLLGNLRGGFNPYGGSQLSQTDTLFKNNRWYLLSNFRQLLSELYVEHGIIQTLIDQPVEDAFRAGFEIRTGQLSPEEIEQLETHLESNNIIRTIKNALKWTRLYGGGGVLLITDQDASSPLSIDALANSEIKFKAVDMWELYYSYLNTHPTELDGEEVENLDSGLSSHYDYYGKRVHRSRVLRVEGKEAPSFIRQRLRGWGMSECERIVRSFNQFLKNQDVIFELVDEAKVDIYKIEGLNNSLMTAGGTNAISNRVQLANSIKNYLNAITMDTLDEYQQKTQSFAGLGEMISQNRQAIAGDLKMPVTKLFGVSAAGFSSGEDDIENYNSMVESEVRGKCKGIVADVIKLVAQSMFGVVPEDLKIIFKPLRILSAKDEEDVKDKKFNRLTNAYTSGLVDRRTWAEGVNKDSLLPVEVDENAEAMPPLAMNQPYGTEDGDEE